MGLICIFTGILFFINPNIRMLDLFPDVIGCILILFGTSKLAYTDARIADAKKYIKYLTFIGAIKIPLSIYIAFYEDNYLLPATFLYSVLEAILMIGFFTSLFGGLDYLVSRCENSKDHSKNSENAAIIAFIFSIARAICGFIPEVLSLGKQNDSFDYTFTPTLAQNAAILKPYAEVLCMVIIIILGIYAAVLFGKYFISLSRDKAFIKNLKEKYNIYIKENSSLINYGYVSKAMGIFFIALLLLFNQILDFINVIPNTLSYIFLIIGCMYMIKYLNCKSLKKIIVVFFPLILLSLYNNYVQYNLLSQTDIDIFNTTLYIKSVPNQLQSTAFLPNFVACSVVEYFILGALIIVIAREFDNLPFLRDMDSVSIFEILFGISFAAVSLSSVYIYVGQFARTAFTFVSNSIDVYSKYDYILAAVEIILYISFVLMLYFAYRYGMDVLSRIKTSKDEERF